MPHVNRIPGIVRNFILKYRKLLFRFAISCVNDTQTASQIIEEVRILRAISWLQIAWKILLQKSSRIGSERVVLMLKISVK